MTESAGENWGFPWVGSVLVRMNVIFFVKVSHGLLDVSCEPVGVMGKEAGSQE